MKSIEPARTVEFVEPSLVELVPRSGMLIMIPSGGSCSISPTPAEIPPPSLPTINTSRSSQGYHKKPEGDMNIRVANLANERNFCITWPWLDTHHVGIETKACYEISWLPVKRKLQLSPANSDNNYKLACTTNPAQNKERRKQVRMVVGFVPGDSVPTDEVAIGLPEFEE
jgi:hypothetical protein